jgi:hypothetical protein
MHASMELQDAADLGSRVAALEAELLKVRLRLFLHMGEETTIRPALLPPYVLPLAQSKGFQRAPNQVHTWENFSLTSFIIPMIGRCKA